MKILYLTDQTYLHGGIEKVLSQKTNYLADVSGDEVFIVTYNQQSKQPIYHFSEKITMIDLAINYEISRSYFHPKNLKKIPKHLSALKTVLKKIKPDVVISSSFGPDFYFIPFAEKQIPKIKEFHTTRFFRSDLNSFKQKNIKKLSEFIEKKYDKLVILNEDERKFYKSENIEIIPNPAAASKSISKVDKKKLISAGRISYQKNYEDLITVAKFLKKDFPDWEIHIYGEDYLNRKRALEKNILTLGLEDFIQFKGTTADLKFTFLDYSIYLMTSNFETFPMVLLEALSVGLPIVSYDCPTGPSRIITNKSDGFLVEYKNLDIFTEKLRLLMQDENLRQKMGKNAIQNVKRFEINIVMQKWKNLFNELM